MKRFNRASNPAVSLAEWPAAEPALGDSPRAGASGGCRCGCLAERAAGPRCHGGTSPDSPAWPAGEPAGCGPGTEPLAPTGPSPARGYPGSFGELTYGSLTSLRLVGFGGCLGGIAFLGVARDGNQCVALTQVHQPNALGLSPGLANLASCGPDDTAT